jgi:hypothetical protein
MLHYDGVDANQSRLKNQALSSLDSFVDTARVWRNDFERPRARGDP